MRKTSCRQVIRCCSEAFQAAGRHGGCAYAKVSQPLRGHDGCSSWLLIMTVNEWKAFLGRVQGLFRAAGEVNRKSRSLRALDGRLRTTGSRLQMGPRTAILTGSPPSAVLVMMVQGDPPPRSPTKTRRLKNNKKWSF